jgi:phage shock protein C
MSIYRYGEKRGLYRSRNGAILGVCRGLADYFDLSVFWIRAIFVVLLLLSGIWPILGIYILASLLMKPEPIRPIETEEEQEFYDSYVYSRQRAAQRLKRRYDILNKRIHRMEDAVTSREFDWDQRMNA